MIETQILKGNLIKQDYANAFTLNQYDKNISYKVNLIGINGNAYVLDSSDVVTIEWQKPNGRPFLQSSNITKGDTYVTILIPEAVTQYAGAGSYNIIITNGGARKGTIKREYSVIANSVRSGTNSEDVITDVVTELRELNATLTETVQNNQEIINSNTAATKQDIANVNSSLEEKAKQSVNYINILKYGADNTGANDCSTLLNNILKSFGEDNITVYIPKGNYLIENTIEIPSNTTITGEGTLILNKAYGLHGKNIKNVCISDISIIGKVINYHTYFEESDYITIKNVKHSSDTYGFAFMFFHCNYVIFENNVLKSSSSHEWDDGVHFVGNHIKIINNFIETLDDCVSFGLHNIAEANTEYKDIYISGNTLKSNNSRSIMFYYNNSGYSVKDITIENNNCYGSIKMQHDDSLTNIVFYNIIISKNNVEEIGSVHGIDIGGCQYANIQNNIVKFKLQQGINLNGDISDVEIIGNTVMFTGDETDSTIYYYCINMSNAASVKNIFITNNKLVNRYCRGIAPKGDNIIIVNNFFKPIVGTKNTLYSVYASWGNINFMKIENNTIVSDGTVNQHINFSTTYTFTNIFINNNYYTPQTNENFIGGITPTSATGNNAISA